MSTPARKSGRPRKQELVQLEKGYQAIAPDAGQFAKEVVRQFDEILRQAGVPLAVPIEHRLKTWGSIAEKIERKRLRLQTIQDVTDLIGVRGILLFRRDVDTACSLIIETFKVLSREDTVERLGESQFGYSSIHFTVEVPTEWLKVPTVQRFQGLKAELQVRTIAQHLWAASSHVLQYKQESSVPPPMRRAIYRVSALLETIDLEFERLLIEREEYSGTIDVMSEAETLNVDLLEKVLESVWPPQNRNKVEDFDDLLQDLLAVHVTTPDGLRQILKKHRGATLKADVAEAKRRSEDEDYGEFEERIKAGVFFTWTGLTRTTLELELGKKWSNYMYASVMPLSVLGLPKPILGVLRKANIHRVTELATATQSVLLRLHGFQADQFSIITAALKKFRLRLGMSQTEAALVFAESADVEKLWNEL